MLHDRNFYPLAFCLFQNAKLLFFAASLLFHRQNYNFNTVTLSGYLGGSVQVENTGAGVFRSPVGTEYG